MERTTETTTAQAPAQLRLLTPPAWRLSETTREIGLQGIAHAREALAAARRANATHDGPTSAAA